jgi:hypothetical protein
MSLHKKSCNRQEDDIVVTLALHRPVMYDNNLVCEALIEGEGEGSERSRL